MRDMYRVVGFAAVVLAGGLTLSGVAADVENPFQNAKVGDYVRYKFSMENGSGKPLATVKHSVKARTEKEVTLLEEVETEGAQKKEQGKEIKIALDKPYNPLATTSEGKPVKVEELEKGTETIKAAGRDYACTWVKCKTTLAKDGKDMVSIVKMWTSKEVALGGAVKTESQIEQGAPGNAKLKTVMDLIESHRAP